MKHDLHRGNPLAVLTKARAHRARIKAITLASSGAVGRKAADWTISPRPLAHAI